MKKNFLFITLIVLSTVSCNTKEKNNSNTQNKEQNETTVNNSSEGYKLMQQKCFICHLAKPDPAKKDAMIAPPMMRVLEHYKPAHSSKKEFVDAVMAIVNKPSEEKTLMPGTIKKFGIMPKLPYKAEELRLIAEALYDTDFGTMPKMQMMEHKKLLLNNGEKWKLKPETMAQMDLVAKKLEGFSSEDIADYNQLGKYVFDEAKRIMLEDEYTGDLFDQVHAFFGGIENNMHTLMATESMDEAKAQLAELKAKFKDFYNYFEASS